MRSIVKVYANGTSATVEHYSPLLTKKTAAQESSERLEQYLMSQDDELHEIGAKPHGEVTEAELRRWDSARQGIAHRIQTTGDVAYFAEDGVIVVCALP